MLPASKFISSEDAMKCLSINTVAKRGMNKINSFLLQTEISEA